MAESNPFLRVPCAHCKQQIDVNRYIVTTPEAWSESTIHLGNAHESFVGTVRCPHCYHLTTYSQQ